MKKILSGSLAFLASYALSTHISIAVTEQFLRQPGLSVFDIFPSVRALKAGVALHYQKQLK